MLVARVVLLGCLGVFLRLVQNANRFEPARSGVRFLGNVRALYQVAYLHLTLGMGVLGVECAREVLVPERLSWWRILVIFVVTLCGCAFRGFGSHHEPEEIKWRDPDWRYGVIIPNALGIAAMVFSAVV